MNAIHIRRFKLNVFFLRKSEEEEDDDECGDEVTIEEWRGVWVCMCVYLGVYLGV